MKELIKLSITSALEGLNSKKFTSTELVNAHIAQATKCKNLNAYITEIKTIWEIKDDTDLNAYVFTRPAPYYARSGEKTILKDGLHIILS